MPFLKRQRLTHRSMIRDVRPISERFVDAMERVEHVALISVVVMVSFFVFGDVIYPAPDALFFALVFYFYWFCKRPVELPFKMPRYAGKMPDPHNPTPGKGGVGKSDGILFVGNFDDKDDKAQHGRELWLTNSDARTHILYLGTTGAGKTEGLKSMVTNALSWGSGYVYTDGKADTDLWTSLYAMARRFGRDDDMLVLNYMTGNSDDGSLSNSMNPFANGSSSYLTNMITSLMPDAGGDNAMWKERAVALMFALMPALTFKRDKQGYLLDVGSIRENIELQPLIRLARDTSLPERIVRGIQGYLNTLPGYVDAAFDDDGNERPPAPDQPVYDLQVARQQHGYLSMQFTRSLQALADEYGYIFKAQLADIDVHDVVLNRRILVVLIPALEKSGDEAANLGKIVAAAIKGMMGATLGNSIEGSWEEAVGSKQTRSNSPFITVFDEVGYYTAQGMAVMAAQARSLGFSLVFASQDLPSMEKRVKQEAKSIVGNCNLKLFGKLEDPTDTADFLQKHTGTSFLMETSGMSANQQGVGNMLFTNAFTDNRNTGGIQSRANVTYDHVRNQREGEVHAIFGEWIVRAKMFYAVADKVKALRVHRLLPVAGTTTASIARERVIEEMAEKLKQADWTATRSAPAGMPVKEIANLVRDLAVHREAGKGVMESGILSLASFESTGEVKVQADDAKDAQTDGAQDRSAFSIPMQAGDEYAVQELDKGDASADMDSDSRAGSGIAGSDADLDIVVSAGGIPIDDIMAVALPAHIAAMITDSAKALNRGLSGARE